MKLIWSMNAQRESKGYREAGAEVVRRLQNMPAFKGCQADGRFIDCEECRWAQFHIWE